MLAINSTSVSLESSARSLSLESTLQDLFLYNYQIEVHHLGEELAKIFAEDALLPGAILLESGNFLGMISRQRFLEFMSRPFGIELFIGRPLKRLYQFAQSNALIVPVTTSVVDTARQSLQRPLEQLYEPIVVQLDAQDYRLLDVHHLLIANSQIHELTTRLLQEQTQAKLIQTEKMTSLGKMVAEVAHEILNPVNFISGNINYLTDYNRDLFRVLDAYEAHSASASENIQAIKEEVDFEFLIKDLPQVISSMQLGAERLQKIIGALRGFSHMDEENKRSINIHECLDNTLLILNNRLKHSIHVVKNYGDIPTIHAYSGQLSQVFMNLISNAIDALMEFASNSAKPDWEPRIEVTTTLRSTQCLSNGNQQWVAVYIYDNGPGIAPEIQSRIFDTFFTTKPVGQGTGLGLAISRQIVTEKHDGELNAHSVPGNGTTFEILLPLL